ncbi:hypothetical protein GO495_19855 [Chitinophaga oryziterrae]|uniref:Cyclic GMP-AMP synthase n=2 Tax=Chitinophaga oryziterrae TaxID=1031224 RepID=A0A6N8JCC2_9BACT|nr:hypothetical protein [Chitinophaga oryziterrae]
MAKNYSLLRFDEQLEFHSQGSFVMDTIITPKDDDFDLDDGVYFVGSLSPNQRPPVSKFHEAVVLAVGHDEDYAKVTDKDTCVRVAYEKEKFHIDLPIYYANSIYNPNLAHLPDEWVLSNPIEFIDWFEKKVMSGFKSAYLVENRLYTEYQQWLSDIRKKDAQLRRMVRYLKAWGDELRGDMPPGIVMTILAAENYFPHEQDDVSLKHTLENIEKFLKANGCSCPRPTTPKGEDLFASYSNTRKEYFMDRLATFVNSAKQAIASDNQKEACLKWQKHLGSRFPCSLASDKIEGATTYSRSAIIGDSANSA